MAGGASGAGKRSTGFASAAAGAAESESEASPSPPPTARGASSQASKSAAGVRSTATSRSSARAGDRRRKGRGGSSSGATEDSFSSAATAATEPATEPSSSTSTAAAPTSSSAGPSLRSLARAAFRRKTATHAVAGSEPDPSSFSSGLYLGCLRGALSAVRGVAWSPDGASLGVAFADGTLQQYEGARFAKCEADARGGAPGASSGAGAASAGRPGDGRSSVSVVPISRRAIGPARSRTLPRGAQGLAWLGGETRFAALTGDASGRAALESVDFLAAAAGGAAGGLAGGNAGVSSKEPAPAQRAKTHARASGDALGKGAARGEGGATASGALASVGAGSVPPWVVDPVHARMYGCTLRGSLSSPWGAPVLASASAAAEVRVVLGDGSPLGSAHAGGLETTDVAVSSDGRWVAPAASSADVKVFQVASNAASGAFEGVRKATWIAGHRGTVRSLAFSPSGLLLATSSVDGTLRRWDLGATFADDAAKAWRGPVGAPLPPETAYDKLAWGPRDVLAAAQGHMLHFLDAETGDVLARETEAHAADIVALVWAPGTVRAGGKKRPLLLSGAADGSLRLWASPRE